MGFAIPIESKKGNEKIRDKFERPEHFHLIQNTTSFSFGHAFVTKD